MKVWVKPFWGENDWQERDGVEVFRLPTSGGMVRLTFDDNELPAEVAHGQQLVRIFKSSTECRLECCSNLETRHKVTVRLAGSTVHRLEFVDENAARVALDLRRDLSQFDIDLEQWCTRSSPTLKNLEQVLNEGKRLRLLAFSEPRSGYDPSHRLTPIRGAMSYLMMVCHKPRLHLDVEEAIRPVSVVRRTGPAALRHLAQHSEHWQAISASGPRPARLLAQVVEDDYDLYENRFVVTLIRRLDFYLQTVRREVERPLAISRNALLFNNPVAPTQELQTIQTLLLPRIDFTQLDSYSDLLRKARSKVIELQAQLSACKATTFFQSLKHVPSVARPIRRTNILTMDTRYRALLALWQHLDREPEGREELIDGDLPEDLDLAYSRYCQVVLMVALVACGYEPEDPACLLFNPTAKHFEARGKYRRDPWSIQARVVRHGNQRGIIELEVQRTTTSVSVPQSLPAIRAKTEHIEVNDRTLTLKGKLTPAERDEIVSQLHPQFSRAGTPLKKLQLDWKRLLDQAERQLDDAPKRRIALVPLLSILDPTDPLFEQDSAALLDQATSYSSQIDLAGTIVLSPSLVHGGESSGSSLHRLLNYGDTFLGRDAERWGNFKTGMLPISRWQYNALLRLIRFIHLHTLRIDLEEGNTPEQCPVCDSTTFRRNLDGQWYCFSCQSQWGATRCGNSKCGHKFGWIRPERVQTKGPASEEETDYGVWLETLESSRNPRILPSFCEAQRASRATFPICPKCGRCSRETEFKAECPRCREGSASSIGSLHRHIV